MARPREFEKEAAVKAALEVFWRQGYQATSVQDLVEATGVNRGSLYDTFGDKHGLFLEAVEYYRCQISARRLTQLEGPGPLRDKLATFFDDMIAFSVGEGRLLGCLMTNAAIEMAPHDRDTACAVAANMAAMETAFRRLLTAAQKKGEVDAKKSPRDLARFLTATANGLRVMAKVTPERTALKSVVRVALQALD